MYFQITTLMCCEGKICVSELPKGVSHLHRATVSHCNYHLVKVFKIFDQDQTPKPD